MVITLEFATGELGGFGPFPGFGFGGGGGPLLNETGRGGGVGGGWLIFCDEGLRFRTGPWLWWSKTTEDVGARWLVIAVGGSDWIGFDGSPTWTRSPPCSSSSSNSGGGGMKAAHKSSPLSSSLMQLGKGTLGVVFSSGNSTCGGIV